MGALLYGVVAWAMSGLVPLLLVGAGMSLVLYAGMEPLLNDLLQTAVQSIGGLPEIALQLLLLTGIGESMSILGSALLTRMAITMASNIAGIQFGAK